MPRHTYHREHAPVVNHGNEGGPWCSGCGSWTECDGDALAGNVCVRCGRPGVVLKAPAREAWEKQAAGAKLAGKGLTAEEVHRLYEVMRAAVEAGGQCSVSGVQCSEAESRKAGLKTEH